MDFDNCACSGRSLGKLLRPAILAILAHHPLHGYLIARRLTALPMFSEAEPDHAGLYRTLKSMEEEQLVSSEWDLADSGPARRQFALTPEGRKCLVRWVETLRTYRDAIDGLLAFGEGELAGGRR